MHDSLCHRLPGKCIYMHLGYKVIANVSGLCSSVHTNLKTLFTRHTHTTTSSHKCVVSQSVSHTKTHFNTNDTEIFPLFTHIRFCSFPSDTFTNVQLADTHPRYFSPSSTYTQPYTHTHNLHKTHTPTQHTNAQKLTNKHTPFLSQLPTYHTHTLVVLPHFRVLLLVRLRSFISITTLATVAFRPVADILGITALAGFILLTTGVGDPLRLILRSLW